MVGHCDRGDLIETQQAGEVDGVLGVGLDALTGWFLQLRMRHDLAPDLPGLQLSVEPESGRAGLVGHRHWTW